MTTSEWIMVEFLVVEDTVTCGIEGIWMNRKSRMCLSLKNHYLTLMVITPTIKVSIPTKKAFTLNKDAFSINKNMISKRTNGQAT